MRCRRILRWFSVVLAIFLMLPIVSTAQDQTGSESADSVPLKFDQAGAQDDSDSAPRVYVDGAITPEVEAPVEQVVPFSLRGQADAAALSIPVDVRLPPLDAEQMQRQSTAAAASDPPLQIGVVRGLPQAITSGDRASGPGHWQQASEGGNYWTLTIESPDAKAMRVHLENLVIPVGGHIMVYNTRNPNEVYGPYQQRDLHGNSDLWTTSVFGPVVTLEYYSPADIDPAHHAGFRVTEIAHIYAESNTLLQPLLLPCHNDVTCHSGWADEANGVAGLGTINGGAALWCSGALLNDFDDGTDVGYFLTANHCLSGNNSDLGTQAQANAIEYYWLYQTPNCNGTPPVLANVPRTATGADLISRQTRDGGNDHAFLRIKGNLPGGISLLGWDTAAFSKGDDAIGIHHPGGSHKRTSFGDISGSDSNYWDVDWSSGTTEPGSSGSPIFDAAHRIRGQLWGDNRKCPPDGGSTYGRYDVTYPNIRRWLEIGGTINVDSSYTGDQEGTPAKPFRTVVNAYWFAWDGSRLRFRGGNYPTPGIILSKQITLIAQDGVVTIGR